MENKTSSSISSIDPDNTENHPRVKLRARRRKNKTLNETTNENIMEFTVKKSSDNLLIDESPLSPIHFSLLDQSSLNKSSSRRLTMILPELPDKENSEMKENLTYSPVTPKYKFSKTQDVDVSIKSPEFLIGRRSLRSAQRTSTPFTKPPSVENTPKLIRNRKSVLKSPFRDVNTINLVNDTPKSIIKKRSTRFKTSLERSPKELKNLSDQVSAVSYVTVRKRRSYSDSDTTDMNLKTKLPRVTFHPNTSVFQIDDANRSSRSSTDDSFSFKTDSSRKEVNVSLNPLNDVDDYTNLVEPVTPNRGLDLLNAPKIEGVNTLNETFTPQKEESKNSPLLAEEVLKVKQTGEITKVKKIASEKLNSSASSKLNFLRKRSITVTPRPKKAVSNSSNQQTSTLTPGLTKLNISKHNKENTTLNKLTVKENAEHTPKKNKGSSVKKIPDFASIHKKNMQRMEAIDDYVQRKKDRAKKLFAVDFSNKNEENVLSSVNTSTAANKKTNDIYTRFGFRVRAQKKETAKEKVKNKQPAVQNIETIRTKERQYVKGVRSNRRFDLLMQARESRLE